MAVSFLLTANLAACSSGDSGSTLPHAVTAGLGTTAAANSNATATQTGTSRSTTSAIGAVAPAPNGLTELAINAGGPAVGSWVADESATGGWDATASGSVDTSHITDPAPAQVYEHQRVGPKLTYTIGNLTKNEPYEVRLHFAETYFNQVGKRVFNVTINGSPVLTNFDIFKVAGGAFIAVVQTFSHTADATGTITVAFNATVDNAAVAGLDVRVAASSPSPVPTPTPTPAPTPTPTPTPGDTAWPAPGWVPYSVSPLTVPVTPNPTFTAGSDAIINAMYSGRSNDPGRLQLYAGPPPPDTTDYSEPLYFGRAGDPAYTVSCYDYGGNCPASGVTVHIPNGAQPAGGTDHHIAIRDTVTGEDVMLWKAPVPSGNGGSYSVGWGTLISSKSDGLRAIGGTASGLSALWALRETDLAHNTVNHAIIVQINGESQSGWAYPAVGWDNGFFHADPWPEMGAHFWLDVAPPYAANCPQYAVSYLTALNKYGAYFAANGGVTSPFEAIYESDLSYTYNGGPSVWGPLMASLGGKMVGTSNIAMDSCGINLQQHMHVLNPPSPL